MTIYTPNNKSHYVILLALLLLLLLMLVPLRPTHWNKEELTALTDTLNLIKDSVVVTPQIVVDTQIIVQPSLSGSDADTSIVVTQNTIYDTIIISVNSPILLDNTETDNPQRAGSGSGMFVYLIYLFSFLFSLVILVVALIRFLSTRMEKKYWVEYNSGTALLDPKKIAVASTMDFVISAKDLVVTKDVITTKEPVITEELEPVQEKVVLEHTPEPIQEPTSKKESKKEVQEQINNQLKEKLKEKHKAKDESIPLGTTIQKTLIEYSTRPIRIVIEVIKGIASIFSYFSAVKSDKTPTTPKPIDFKWQDVISILTSISSLLTIRTFYSITPDRVIPHILLYTLLWTLPSFLRKNWKRGVFGVLLLVTELVALLVYWVLELSKDAPPSSGFDINWNYILGAVGLIAIIVVIKQLLSKIKIPKLNIKTLLHGVVVVGAAIFLFKDYCTANVYEVFYFNNAWVGLVSRGFILYLIYLTGVYLKLASETQKEPPKVTINNPQNKAKEKKPLDVKQTPKEQKKDTELFSLEKLKLIVQQKKWWEKVPLDRLEEVSMPNYNLDEQSEFVELYLPECINARRLYLSNNLFTEIPFEVTELEQLELLNLSYNNISKVGSEIQYLENLNSLYLSHNNLKKLPEEIGLLKNLKFLDLTGNPLSLSAYNELKEWLPNTLIKCDTPLDVEENEKATLLEENETLVEKVERLLQKELQNPDAVYYISTLMEQNLNDLPLSVLQKFKNVKSILLHNNQFTKIPEALYHIPSLTSLSLPYNKLTTIPDRIEDLPNLEELDVTNNPIISFSPKIVNLEKLKSLRLSYLGLKEIPAFVFQMKGLTNLTVSGNHLLRLSDSLASLTELKNLDLSFTGLPEIPSSVLSLENLEYLNWAGNQLKEVPIALGQLPKLNSLSISYNEGVVVPTKLFAQLSNLKTIYLAGLKMDENNSVIPFNWLANVTSLWLNNNLYSVIPKGIFEMQDLTSLSLNNNVLTKISGNITQLKNLRYLYLSNNKLKHLPKNLRELKKLTALHLQNNDFDEEEKQRIRKMLPNVTVLF